MSHWLEKALEILTSPTADLADLARIAGEDPRTFYRGADLSGADLRGQDLSQFDLTGANLNDAVVDNIDFDIAADELESPKRRTFYLGRDLNHILDLYCAKQNYTYRAWAIKALLYRVVTAIGQGRTSLDEIAMVMTTHPYLRTLTDPYQGRVTQYHAQLDANTFNVVLSIGKRINGRRSGFTAAVAAGLILHRMLELSELASDFDLLETYGGRKA